MPYNMKPNRLNTNTDSEKKGNNSNERISIIVTSELKIKMKKYAIETGVSMSDEIRPLLEQYYDNKGK